MPLMHPLMRKNFGDWAWHDRLRPGVLHHTANSGDEIWTVRAGTPRQLDVFTIRLLCDIGDEFADGHVRFTARSNIEYMVGDIAKVEPLIEKLEDEGFPIGGTGNSISMIAHTQGWLHCDIPGTDASGRGQVSDGRAPPRVHPRGNAQSCQNQHLVLPGQLRRTGRYLNQRAVHQNHRKSTMTW